MKEDKTMANINIRIDDDVKAKAESIFKKLGLTPTTAINLFYHQVIRTNSIPFELKAEIPNKATMAAIREVKEMEKNPGNYTAYKNVDDLLEDLSK